MIISIPGLYPLHAKLPLTVVTPNVFPDLPQQGPGENHHLALCSWYSLPPSPEKPVPEPQLSHLPNGLTTPSTLPSPLHQSLLPEDLLASYETPLSY